MSDNPAATDQVGPVKTTNVRIVDVVIEDVVAKFGPYNSSQLCNDLKDRAEAGFDRYGMYLAPNNGRNSILDSYQEILDCSKYLRNSLAEKWDQEVYSFYQKTLEIASFLCCRLNGCK